MNIYHLFFYLIVISYYKYFDYTSFEEQQTYVDKMDNNEIIEDKDFDDLDDSDLFS